MKCIAMFVNDFTMPETTRTTGFRVFNVRSDTMRRGNCDLCALRDEGCALLTEGDVRFLSLCTLECLSYTH